MAKQRDMFGNLEPDPPAKLFRFDSKNATEKQRELYADFEILTIEKLQAILFSLAGEKYPGMHKPELVYKLMILLDFGTQEEFDSFFEKLAPVARAAIKTGTFFRIVDTKPLEREYCSPIIEKKKGYSFNDVFYLAPALQLDLFWVVNINTLGFPDILRKVFVPFLPKPAHWNPVPVAPFTESSWTNTDGIADSLPLVLEALKEENIRELVRKGFLKAANRRFAEKCGIPVFPVADKFGLYSAGLIARFFAAFGSKKQSGQGDSADYIKAGVVKFFDQKREISFSNNETGRFFEFRVLTEHLSKRSGAYNFEYPVFPLTRETLYKTLERASSGEWFKAVELFDSAWFRNEPLSIIHDRNEIEDFKLNGTRLTFASGIIDSGHGLDFFHPNDQLNREILALPLFKSYLYLFAALGILEIREKQPELRLKKGGKDIPVSMYDGLDCIRITGFGLWCLQFVSKKPERSASSALVLADANLPILTIQGQSLEKRLFLESIGEKLGPERYRVTEASFISGCESAKAIEKRITRFGELVTADPPPRWKAFFNSVRAKSGIFLSAEQAFLFKLPDDEEVRQVFYRDPALRAFALKAEGGYIVVRRSDYHKLLKALLPNGFFCPAYKDLVVEGR